MLLSKLIQQPPDPLLSLIALANSDKRAEKIDLGVGVYRDDTGKTPVMQAVKLAEAELFKTQLTKAYLGAEGDSKFVVSLEAIVFGNIDPSRLFGLQTPGGTGALRLGAELIHRASPDATIWIGTPSWPNHQAIFDTVGLAVKNYRWFDTILQKVCFGELLQAVGSARRGDVFILHAASHNPTGADLSCEQWDALIDAMADAGVVPFIDSAYQGLGRGLEEDAYGLRACFKRLPEAMLAYSCDKNFGLYRDRVGALWINAENPSAAANARANILALARANWSMPPDHGAAIVRIILNDPVMAGIWHDELSGMRRRIGAVRSALAASHPALASVRAQSGMFSMLPLCADSIRDLRDRHSIYVTGDGRINVAGLRVDQVERAARFLGAL